MDKFTKYLFPTIFFASVFYIIFSFYGDWNKIKSLFLEINFSFIIFLLLLSILNYFFRFLKWHYYLGLVSRDVKFLESLLIFNSALSLSFSPGKIGDLIKSLFLKKSHNIDISKTASIILVERITDFTSLLLISIFGAYSFNYGLKIIIPISFFFLIIIVFISIPNIGKPILIFFLRIKFLKKFLNPFITAYETSSNLLLPKRLILMTLLSLVAWFFECLGFYIILINFKVQISLFGASFIYAFSTIIGAVTMLPAGIGFTESSLTFLLLQNGVIKSIAVFSTLLIRLVTLWFAVLFGLANLLIYKFYNKNRKIIL